MTACLGRFPQGSSAPREGFRGMRPLAFVARRFIAVPRTRQPPSARETAVFRARRRRHGDDHPVVTARCQRHHASACDLAVEAVCVRRQGEARDRTGWNERHRPRADFRPKSSGGKIQTRSKSRVLGDRECSTWQQFGRQFAVEQLYGDGSHGRMSSNLRQTTRGVRDWTWSRISARPVREAPIVVST